VELTVKTEKERRAESTTEGASSKGVRAPIPNDTCMHAAHLPYGDEMSIVWDGNTMCGLNNVQCAVVRGGLKLERRRHRVFKISTFMLRFATWGGYGGNVPHRLLAAN
jgi:hypothetical protein